MCRAAIYSACISAAAIGILHRTVPFTVMCLKCQPSAAVGAVQITTQSVGVTAPSRSPLHTLSAPMYAIPQFLRYDRLVRILEHILFLLGCAFPLMQFEIGAYRFTQNRVSKILLSFQYAQNRRHSPQVGIGILLPIVLPRMVFLCVGRWNQNLFFRQLFRDCSCTFPSLASKKIRFTTSAATGPMTSACLSDGTRLYP